MEDKRHLAALAIIAIIARFVYDLIYAPITVFQVFPQHAAASQILFSQEKTPSGNDVSTTAKKSCFDSKW